MTISNNPFECGKKLKTGFDYFAKGFSKNDLVDVFYHLISDRRQGQLLLEAAEFCDVDDMYNPGEEIDDSSDRLSTSEVMILEAVRVRQFAQTAKTMAALQRVLNKKLESLGDITAGEAIIGKPKKTGLFASVTVQFPLSDGQTLSIIFHSPEGNKMKITASDEILAFRWLLNKRDITVAVAPDSAEEGNLPGLPAAGKDVSLEDVGMRCAQLISKNSARFAAKSAELVAAKKLKEELSVQADQLQASNGQLQQDLSSKIYEDEQAAAKINAIQKQLENQINYNEELRAKLEGMKATGAGNNGKADGEDTTGGVDKVAADAALFEEKKANFIQELKGRDFQDDSNGGATFYIPDQGGYISAGIHHDETSKDVFVKYQPANSNLQNKAFAFTTIAGIDKQVADALKWIDKKLADLKKKEAKQPDKTFVTSPDGSTDFGMVSPEIEKASEGRFPAAPIRLEEGGDYGKAHIAEERVKEFQEYGYADELAALNDITKNYTDIFEQPTGRLLLVKRNGRGKYASVELQNKGGYYGVTTWFLEDKNPKSKTPYEERGGRKLLLHVAHADDSDQPSQFPTPDDNGQDGDSRRSDENSSDSTLPPADENVNPDRDHAAEIDIALATLDDIISGKYTDSTTISDVLDAAAAKFEEFGVIELPEIDAKLNKAADFLTGILKTEAAGVM